MFGTTYHFFKKCRPCTWENWCSFKGEGRSQPIMIWFSFYRHTAIYGTFFFFFFLKHLCFMDLFLHNTCLRRLHSTVVEGLGPLWVGFWKGFSVWSFDAGILLVLSLGHSGLLAAPAYFGAFMLVMSKALAECKYWSRLCVSGRRRMTWRGQRVCCSRRTGLAVGNLSPPPTLSAATPNLTWPLWQTSSTSTLP